jgi:hypothetical protein
MRYVIEMHAVRDAIDRALDAAFLECPDAEKHREVFHAELLRYYDEHGELPDFKLTKKEKPTE